jgi:enterochelin esterase family protein
MAATLKSKHYAYQYTFALNAGQCDRKVREQTLPEALEWVWRDYRPKPL